MHIDISEVAARELVAALEKERAAEVATQVARTGPRSRAARCRR